MSLLSILEATPNRVRSLTRLTAALGQADRQVLRSHLMPTSTSADQFSQLMRETQRLKLITEVEGNQVVLASHLSQKQVEDDSRFLAVVEDALMTDDSEVAENKSLRYALAWLLTQQSGKIIAWNSDQHPTMLTQMEGDDIYDVTNQSRFAMLCYWSRYLGYAESLQIGNTLAVIPDPSSAIARRLPSLFSENARLPISNFFDALGRQLSVVETGAVRRSIEQRMRQKRPSNTLSVSTSLALLKLEVRGLIRLPHASDAETWLLASSIDARGAGQTRPVSHVEFGASGR